MDSADGIKGIPGKGIAYYNKLFQTHSGIDRHEEILTEYTNYFGQSQGIYEFQKNYRMLHLLEDDADFLREAGYVPELPNFLDASKVKAIDINFD